ncbi:glycoprotein-N-acetylgalactosamine 3-beta-galactosyltransferase 1-like [Lytechinus pictus]|uniref:glycoprotein-N-acetylgalactosamine 3-beta-galactosyltransferase 1-like n=1 Tax=Lytechinus pictus TaxID=7653 RepID=UPI0030B9E870
MAPIKGNTGGFIRNFCFGLFFGCCITYATVKFSRSNVPRTSTIIDSDPHRKDSLLQPDGHVVVDEGNRVLESELKHFEDSHHHEFVGQDAIAQVLYEKVRILCWVMTGPQNIDTKAVHIHATWGKRCNKVIFISSEPSDKIPIVKVATQEGRDFLWQKTRGAFQYIYDNLLNDYDWFLKADDDTFVIVENLRYFLLKYSPDTSIYFGHKFKPYVRQGYMSGGGGYVTSRQGVKNLVEIAFKDPKKCWGTDHRGGAEDVEIGKCLENAGVVAGDSRDALQRNRFHPFQPEAHLNPNGLPENFWYWNYIYYPRNEGYEGCCSDYSVTFHYIPPAALYNLEYLVYHLRPFGVGTFPCPVDVPKEILQEARSRQQSQHRGEQLPHQEQPPEDQEEKRAEQGKESGQEKQEEAGQEEQGSQVKQKESKVENEQKVVDKPKETEAKESEPKKVETKETEQNPDETDKNKEDTVQKQVDVNGTDDKKVPVR